jgi:rhodanese-related sulfurtransferase
MLSFSESSAEKRGFCNLCYAGLSSKQYFRKKKGSMRIVLFIGVLLLASCSESQVQVEEVEEKAGHQVVSAEKFKEALAEDDIQVIDVRTAAEYQGGTIGDAVNIDVMSSDFKTKIATLDKSKKTLIFCKVGGRSGRAGAMMEEMGFETVIDLSGGYAAWPYK